MADLRSYDTIGPEQPAYPWAMKIADALRGARTNIDMLQLLHPGSRLITAGAKAGAKAAGSDIEVPPNLGQVVGLGQAPEAVERLAYGKSLYTPKANRPLVEQVAPGTLDLAGLAAGPVARGASIAVEQAPAAARVLRENAAAPTARGAAAAQRGAIILPSPRMSAEEARAAGYFHPVGEGAKLSRPVSEMTSTHEPIEGAMVPRKVITPEDLQGSMIVPALGDRSRAGSYLTHVNEQELTRPVLMEGGPNYMRTHAPHGSAWASDAGVITGLSNKIRRAAETGRDVNMAHVAMGPGSLDFNTMTTETLLDLLRQAPVTQKAKQALNAEVRTARPDFVGLDNPQLDEQLFAPGAAELRKALTKTMAKAPYQKAGFPDVPAVRKAITEPELLDAPHHATGFTIARMDPSGRIITDPHPDIAHGTYPRKGAGQYIGGLEEPLPRDVAFSNFYKQQRASGAPTKDDFYTFMRQTPVQHADQEWLDNVMKWKLSEQLRRDAAKQ